MNKERKVINPKAIIVFDKDVHASELNKITHRGKIVINKKLIIDADLNMENTIFVMGNIIYKSLIYDYSINVKGSLYCYGHVNCHNINVSSHLYCEDGICSKNIKVRENFWCNNKINAYGGDVTVAGDLECMHEVEADCISVLGSMHIHGRVDANKINVGY